jgi:hypothetical protein
MKLEILGTRKIVKLNSGILQPYQSSEAKGSFVFMEPRAKGYASECNELCWFQKKFSTIWTRLDSSAVKQKS